MSPFSTVDSPSPVIFSSCRSWILAYASQIKAQHMFLCRRDDLSSPITGDKHSDISSRSKDEVWTNGVCSWADGGRYSDGWREKKLPYDSSLAFFSILWNNHIYLFISGPNRTVCLFLSPQTWHSLGFSSHVLILALLWMTVIQCFRVVLSLFNGKPPHAHL